MHAGIPGALQSAPDSWDGYGAAKACLCGRLNTSAPMALVVEARVHPTFWNVSVLPCDYSGSDCLPG